MLRKLSTWLSQNKSPLAKLGGMSAPIVVGGTGGSGTRVVQALLSDVGVYMGKALNQPGDAMQFEPLLDEKINPVLSQVHSLDYTPDAVEKELRKEILQIIHQTAALYIEDMPQGANSEGNPRWGWKNPRSMFLLPLIHSVFPELYYIHVVRDGRDMAFSKTRTSPINITRRCLTSPTAPPPAKKRRCRRSSCGARRIWILRRMAKNN